MTAASNTELSEDQATTSRLLFIMTALYHLWYNKSDSDVCSLPSVVFKFTAMLLSLTQTCPLAVPSPLRHQHFSAFIMTVLVSKAEMYYKHCTIILYLSLGSMITKENTHL